MSMIAIAALTAVLLLAYPGLTAFPNVCTREVSASGDRIGEAFGAVLGETVDAGIGVRVDGGIREKQLM